MVSVIISFLAFFSLSFATSEDEPILHAVKRDDTVALQSLLDHPDKIKKLYGDEVLLHYAVKKNSQNSIHYLLNHGADVNRFHDKKSPLILAIQKKKADLAALLIEKGAFVNLADHKGNTPLIHAVKSDHLSMIRLLFESGANYKAQNNRGKRASNYVDNYNENPVLSYFNRMILLHHQMEELPDFSDGPHVFIGEDKVKVTYFKRDSSKNRTWKTWKHFPVKDNFVEFDGFAGDTNKYKLNLNPEKAPASFNEHEKIFAMGDLHGQMDAMLEMLRNQKIIDQNNRWKWGAGDLIITGDVFDRGRKVTETLWYLHNLKKEARRQGGDVHMLLGNHEIMTMTGDYRYLHPKYKHFAVFFKQELSELYGPDTYLGRWLRNRNVTMKMNNIVFVHGGFSPHIMNQKLALDTINQIIRLHLEGETYRIKYIQDLLLSSVGPLWYRGYLMGENADTPVRQVNIDQMLAFYDAEMIVVGHSEQFTIRSLYNDKVWAIDVPLGRKGYVAQGLMIKNDTFIKCGECGSRTIMKRKSDSGKTNH